MANINHAPTYQNRDGRSGFDLSNRFAFSSSVGQLLPVYVDELYPGDHVKLSADMFTRTEPLNKAAFTRVTEHIDYFFVPFTQLYSLFDSFITSVDDIKSSLVDNTGVSDYLPFIDGQNLFSAFRDMMTDQTPEEGGNRSYTDEFNVPLTQNAFRLLDMLGYGTRYHSFYKVNMDGMPRLNPFRLAAYQKIFFDYYRLTDWTANDNRAYNLDQFYQDGLISPDVITKLLKIRYRPWKKDYFTNVLPSPLVGQGSTNIMNNITDDVKQWLSNSAQLHPINPSGQESTTLPTTVEIDTSNVTANLRTAFAFEKLLEVTRRAGKHYDLQTLAHFGVKPPRRVDGDVFYLGSQSSPIQISDVVSTAQTDGASLGEIGGKGFGNMRGNGVDFTCQQHGIIMAIYSAVPESDYVHWGIDRQNTYQQKYDYFTPELDNIGMQPLFGSDVNFLPVSNVSNSKILAWQYRYMESKAKADTAHGKFYTAATGWLTYRNVENMIQDSEMKYYINPSYLNPIMEVNYLTPSTEDDPAPNDENFNNDPLIHDLYFKSYKTSKMSTYGLPSL